MSIADPGQLMRLNNMQAIRLSESGSSTGSCGDQKHNAVDILFRRVWRNAGISSQPFTGTMSPCFCRMVRIGLLLLVNFSATVHAFSTDNFDAARLPSRSIDVESLEVVPPRTHAEQWEVKLSTSDTQIQFLTRESWHFRDEALLLRATKGSTYLIEEHKQLALGWARLVFAGSASNPEAHGAFAIGGEVWHLVRNNNNRYTIWRERDLDSSAKNEVIPDESLHELYKRSDESSNTFASSQELTNSIGNVSGCPKTAQAARIGIAADMNFLAAFNSTAEAQIHLVNTVNKASHVWEQAFNISLVIGQMVIPNQSSGVPWNSACVSGQDDSGALHSRLRALSSWRASDATMAADGFALWSMFTDCPSGNVIGLAWQGTACETAGANIIRHSVLDYRVLAHETGHVFGAVHDCTGETCSQNGREEASDMPNVTNCCPLSRHTCDAGGQFIMNPGSSLQQFIFSACSQGNICSAIGSGAIKTSCLAPQYSIASTPNQMCSSDPASNRYRSCHRNLQCIAITGRQDSYSCGAEDSCSMSCFDPVANQCVALEEPFEDGTPCGRSAGRTNLCFASQCLQERPSRNPERRVSSDLPLWVWIVIAVLSAVAGVAIFCLFLLLCCGWRPHRSRTREAAKYASPEYSRKRRADSKHTVGSIPRLKGNGAAKAEEPNQQMPMRYPLVLPYGHLNNGPEDRETTLGDADLTAYEHSSEDGRGARGYFSPNASSYYSR